MAETMSVPMVDGAPTPAVKIDQSQYAALSPESRASAVANLERYYSKETVSRAIADAARIPPATPSANPTDGRTHGSGDVADGRVSLAEQFDAHLGGAQPGAYDLNGIWLGQDVDITAAKETDSALRETFSAMRIPVAIGKGLAQEMLQAGRQWSTISDATQRQLYLADMRATVAKVTGRSYEEVISIVRPTLIDQIPRATALKLADRGVFETAAVLIYLYRQAERLQARAAMKS